MTLTQRLIFSSDHDRPAGRGLIAMVAAVFALFVAIAAIVFLGVMPAPALSGMTRGASPQGFIAKADDPACAAALARAKTSRGLSGDQAVAAATAMLRACDIH